MISYRRFSELFFSAMKKIRKEGIASVVKKTAEYIYHKKYKYKHPVFSDDIRQKIDNLPYKPLFTIIIADSENCKYLNEILHSADSQWYTNFDVYLVSENSTNIPEKYKDKISSIEKIKDFSKGDFIIFLSDDSVLSPDCLYEIALEVNQERYDLLYFDEDVKKSKSKYINPVFKPDFSYNLLLTYNYFGSCICINKNLLKNMQINKDYSLENILYDISLRCTEYNGSVRHIPKVLFHKLYDDSDDNNLEAVEIVRNHLNRKNISAEVTFDRRLNCTDVRYNLPDVAPLISLIILTKDKLNYLKNFIESIIDKSSYKNYEIIIVDNNSEKEETLEWFDKIQKQFANIKVITSNCKFNYSKLNNTGIAETAGDVLIFLNNDMEIISHDWMERLAGDALQTNVGIVGGLLLFKDYTIQHAGVVAGLSGWCGHVYRFQKPTTKSTPFISSLYKREVLANTGACMCVSRKVLNDIGTFDERFEITDGDVEFSLRAIDNGYVSVFNPYVKLFHYEGKSRGNKVLESDLSLAEVVYKEYWASGDPYFNTNLSLYSLKPKIK